MRVKKSISKHSVSYSIIKDVTINGKRTSKIVERLGNDDEIRAKHPNIDPYEWAKAYANTLNEEEKKGHTQIITKYNRRHLIEKDEKRLFNVGYLCIEKVCSLLDIDTIGQAIDLKHKNTYATADIMRMLIATRLLYPSSKKSAYEQAQSFLTPPNFESHHIYRALSMIAKESDTVEQAMYENSLKLVDRNTKILYYDCTNFYFEIEQEDGLKRYGKSKEHRPNPIVQMGLFMDGSGMPLAFTVFAGNKNEQPTLKAIEKRIIKDFKLSQFVVCTDAGLSSKVNRKFNDIANRAFITTCSLKKLPANLSKWALDTRGWRLAGSDKHFDLTTIDHSSDNKNTYYKERWIKHEATKAEKEQQIKPLEEKIIVTYSPVYKHYQKRIRDQQIQRAIKRIDQTGKVTHKNANDIKRFINEIHATKDGEVAEVTDYTLNDARIKKEAAYDGFYGVYTNLEASPSEIIAVNKRRWQIEESFRIMKTEFKTRPFYLQREERIQAHFLTCFLSLLIYRIFELKLKDDSVRQILKTLREMNWLKHGADGYIPAFERTEITDKLHEFLGFRTDYELFDHRMVKKIKKYIKTDKTDKIQK